LIYGRPEEQEVVLRGGNPPAFLDSMIVTNEAWHVFAILRRVGGKDYPAESFKQTLKKIEIHRLHQTEINPSIPQAAKISHYAVRGKSDQKETI
jgi:hypothetical protein